MRTVLANQQDIGSNALSSIKISFNNEYTKVSQTFLSLSIY